MKNLIAILTTFTTLTSFCQDLSKGWPQCVFWTNQGQIWMSNYHRPVQFEADYQNPITNVIIDENYKGQIQIGTNKFMVAQAKTMLQYREFWEHANGYHSFEYFSEDGETSIELKIHEIFKEYRSDSVYCGMDLVKITNWTGVQANGKELGYQATNHVAHIVYEDTTNDFVLKTTESNIAVWGTNEPPKQLPIWTYAVTNMMWLTNMPN